MFVLLFLVSSAMADQTTQQTTDQTTDQVIQQSNRLMGQELSVRHQSGLLPESTTSSGVTSQSQATFLGHTQNLMQANLSVGVAATPSATPAGGTAQTLSADQVQLTIDPTTAVNDLYIAGKRVWNGTFTQEAGSFVYRGGIAPTQIPFPLVLYPVGPLILEVDAGVSFSVNLVAKLTPGPGVLSASSTASSSTAASDLAPVSVVAISLDAAATGSAYIEGFAQVLVVRGGIGGQITVIDGSANVAADFFQNQAPKVQYVGKLTLLSGHVYAFVDSNLLFGKWKRWWSHDFFKWSGKCYAFGGQVCGL